MAGVLVLHDTNVQDFTNVTTGAEWDFVMVTTSTNDDLKQDFVTATMSIKQDLIAVPSDVEDNLSNWHWNELDESETRID